MLSKIMGDVRYIAITAILGVAALLELISLFRMFGNSSNLSFMLLLAHLIPIAGIGALLVHLVMFHGDGNKLMIYAYCGLSVLSFIFSFLLNRYYGAIGFGGSAFSNIFAFIIPLVAIFVLSTGVIDMKNPMFFVFVLGTAVISIFPGLLGLFRQFRFFPFAEILKGLFNLLISAGVTTSACMLAVDWD